MAENLRHFKDKHKDLGYDHVWIIVDSDGNNFIKTACWSDTFRDSYLRAHPTHVAIRYNKAEQS